MNLKKLITVLLMTMCLTIVMPAFAIDETPLANTEKTNNDTHAQQLMNRLIEIRNMDKSHLTQAEKRALRKEVRQIKKDGQGVYLSIGAIIIIVLLLILLL